jgi:hypothetical protein
VLFTAMYNADADGSTQFFFPKERLPTHTQVRCCLNAAGIYFWPGSRAGLPWLP